jgi:colicin import membrane protein
MSDEKKESEIKENSTLDSASVEEKKQTTIEKTNEADESKAKSETVEAAAKAEAKAAAEAAEAAAKAAAEAEAAAKAAMAKAEELKSIAEKAAEAEYKAIAEEVKAETAKGHDYTFKRDSDVIFRREMGEPEFFLNKKDRFIVPVLSPEQQEELTRKAEIPVDNTPSYNPEHILSPEYGGVSNYESGIGNLLEETRQKLARIKKDPDATEKEIADAKHELAYLESLHENFYLGMNVFRTAKGGRSKIKK